MGKKRELVKTIGRATSRWSKDGKWKLLGYGKPKGYEGHQINKVTGC